jgi:hypothetical protein
MSEPQASIDKRKAAADKWAEWYFPMKSQNGYIKALLVILGTKTTRDYLAEHDPMALKQCQEAVSGKSYIDFMERQP